MIMKMDTFQKILLDHEDFVLRKSFVSFYNDFSNLNNTKILKFCGKIFTSLP